MSSPEFLDPWISLVRTNPQILIGIVTGIWLIWNLSVRFKEAKKAKAVTTLPAPGFPPVEPLRGFDWKNVEPEKFRPFIGKERYNLTMALETLDPSELVPIDKTYRDRVALRSSLVKQHPETVIGVLDPSDSNIRAAVAEYYSFMLGTYLPGRYPELFKLHATELVEGSKVHMLENRVTDEVWPVNLPKDTRRGLEILAKLIDEEVLFLLPDSSSSSSTSSSTEAESEKEKGNGKKEEKYMLKAYSTCFPSGFNTREKLGLRLANIHGPVPGYSEKIERSMDRFFSRIEVGKYVKRVNWSVTTQTELFAAFGGVHGDESEGMKQLKLDELDLDSTVLRCERQTLHRLPNSKALVFAFHTYVYPISEIKEEGLGEELATAIDGLKAGNVPDIYVYKRGPAWGEAVKEYLRS